MHDFLNLFTCGETIKFLFLRWGDERARDQQTQGHGKTPLSQALIGKHNAFYRVKDSLFPRAMGQVKDIYYIWRFARVTKIFHRWNGAR